MSKRKTGQNFLIDRNVAEREVKYADITKDDVVLEVGPGTGILTKLLAARAKKVIAIEIDGELVDKLKQFLPDNVELIHGDALKIDFETLPRFNKIVSNLPFQISSHITFKFLGCDFSLAVLIYQKEFADRMVAKSGSKDYSRLSVGIYYKTNCDIIDTVSRTCFYPQPRVDSCMVKLSPRESPPFSVHDESFFFDLTRELFNHRRKKIKNTLDKIYGMQLKDVPYLDKRVEGLSPEQIGELCNILFSKYQKRI